MEALALFEQLAHRAHYNADIQLLSQHLPQSIRSAVLSKDGEALKSLLAGSAYLANESHIVQIL